MGQFFCEFWLFSSENRPKLADCSVNIDFFPAKIPRNRPFFLRICPWKFREILVFFPWNIRSPVYMTVGSLYIGLMVHCVVPKGIHTSPTEGIFLRPPHPCGNLWAFETPPPPPHHQGISNPLCWGEYGYFLELHIVAWSSWESLFFFYTDYLTAAYARLCTERGHCWSFVSVAVHILLFTKK